MFSRTQTVKAKSKPLQAIVNLAAKHHKSIIIRFWATEMIYTNTFEWFSFYFYFLHKNVLEEVPIFWILYFNSKHFEVWGCWSLYFCEKVGCILDRLHVCSRAIHSHTLKYNSTDNLEQPKAKKKGFVGGKPHMPTDNMHTVHRKRRLDFSPCRPSHQILISLLKGEF